MVFLADNRLGISALCYARSKIWCQLYICIRFASMTTVATRDLKLVELGSYHSQLLLKLNHKMELPGATGIV